MFTVIDRTKDKYLTKKFRLYGELAEEYIDQMVMYATKGDFDKAEEFRLKAIEYTGKRREVLDKLLELKGYR